MIKIVNCIVYGNTGLGAGIAIINQYGVYTMNVYNCTLYNCAVGFLRMTGTFNAINCGAASCTTPFHGTITQTTCSSATPTFVSTTPGSEDLHLQGSDEEWIDQATDESAVFTDDIDGETRPGGLAWDIGADEYFPSGPPPSADNPTCLGVTGSMDPDTMLVTGTGTGANAGSWRVIRVSDGAVMATGGDS